MEEIENAKPVCRRIHSTAWYIMEGIVGGFFEMTLTDIFDQAKALSPQERKELAKLLIDTLDAEQAVSQAKTGAEIVALLETMEPVEFVDSDILDPVEWVKAQRRKRAEQLKPNQDGDQ
jgi:hypothetical protein